jgi:acetoacetyl-CoA synthetase
MFFIYFSSCAFLFLVEQYHEIADALVVGQKYKDDERVILFLKMVEDKELTNQFIEKIKLDIRTSLSPRHVPALVLQIKEIPVRSLFFFFFLII